MSAKRRESQAKLPRANRQKEAMPELALARELGRMIGDHLGVRYRGISRRKPANDRSTI